MDTVPHPDSEELMVAKSVLGFPVVGIGASAGGIEALRRLLGAMPAESGMAFVIVMHLSPDHESSLGAILQRAGSMPVLTVVETTPIEPNHVYVISPAMKLAMSDGHLRVSPMSTLEGRRQSIDLFFRSLAQAHQERSVCIVLSGTGSDGSQGLKRIKELGGVAIAQTTEDAEFDGMPRAAAMTGLVDFMLPVADMPQKLVQLWENARRMALPRPPPGLLTERATGEAEVLAEEALLSIKALLRERTGHDFTRYKRGTVLRRLERRMQVNALPDLPSYRRLLDSEPNETPALLQDMLISVTNFFRDPDAFEALTAALRSAIAERPANEPFRAWVAGCATGEEAYSVAMLLQELLGPSAPPIQVFASDIDQRAIAFARAGLFPASIGTDVSTERLSRFFTSEAGGLRVNKGLRDAVIFSAHNVLSDPPFTRMDLICCRNLMIYLDRSAQEQLLRNFHYALKAAGLLFLGSSEAAEAVDGSFHGVDKIHRVYKANATPVRSRSLPSMPTGLPALASVAMRAPPTEPVRPALEALHESVIRDHAPPTVLVAADDTLLHVSERASHLLRMPGGAPTNKLMALARPELRAELRAALARAAETGKVVQAPSVRLLVNGETRSVVMTARPAIGKIPRGLMLVVFDEAQESLDEGGSERDPLVESLEAELLRTQDQLRSMAGESAASTEELRASNEELQTINEELRSTTEELETSREELQAVNEELTTVNGELTIRVEEATKTNDDLQNLMTSADIGTLFVDRDTRVKRYTPQAATLFNLLPSDTGRPLLDITHRMDYPQLATDISQALRDLKRVEREVQTGDGRRLLARVAPYRTSQDRIEGVVLAFFDVTALREAEERLRSSEQRMALVADSMRDYAIVTMDQKGTITTWSPGAERVFGYSAEEAIGQFFGLIFTEEDQAAGAPGDELERAARLGRANDDRWHVSKGGQKIFCSGITTPLGDDGAAGFAKIARNFTDEELHNVSREAALDKERAASGRFQELSAMKDEFLAIVSHELKNPLSVIQMNALLIRRQPSVTGDPRLERSTQAIMSAVSSQAQIINDLLELSRANMGKIVLNPLLLDLKDLVETIVEAVDQDVGAKGQVLEADFQPARIFGDPVRIEQIVWNLVTNAVKFTPPGGSVKVTLRVEDGAARLTVDDSGIGLGREHLIDVFEMFRQVESGTNRTTTGLGIGLALVKQLTELHGGRVAAESEGVGHGSRFSVWLPLASDESRKLPSLPVDPSLKGLSLLVVDDESDALDSLGALLETEGARVWLASDAEHALELARQEKIDAVVSDVAMPGNDGYWLAKQLRKLPGASDLPLVAVSGRARGIDRARAVEAGFDALISKPLDLDALRLEIVQAVAKRSAARP